jgi:hypothetical protein
MEQVGASYDGAWVAASDQGGKVMMHRNRWRWLLVCVLTLSLVLTTVGSVAAQEESDDGEEEVPTFEHPVVAVFREYFGDEVADEVAAYHPQGQGGEVGGEEPEEEEGEGVGFGVLVKMYAIAAESQEACEGVEEPCGVTVEELMAAYNSGVGMGELYKLYGKPSVLGVGHMKNGGGPPEHAGPKEGKKDKDQDKDKDKDGPPAHAGPKEKEKDKKKDKGGPKDK